MRLMLSLGFVFLMFSSCVTYRSYTEQEQELMTSFNFPAKEGNIETFFVGESKPQKDYLRLGLIKEDRTAYTSNIGGLLEDMMGKARSIGADAIIVMGAGDAEMVYTDSCDDTYSIPKESMWGIAIKYVDEIFYQENILVRMNVVPLTASNGAKGGDIMVDLDGEMAREIPGGLTRYAYLHSLEYLLYSTEGWSYTETPNIDYGYDSYLLRQQTTPLGTVTRLKAKMKVNRMPGEIKVTHLGGRLVNETMQVQTDKDGNIFSRTWTEADRKEVKATVEYGDDGRRVSETYEVKQQGANSFVPLLVMNYEYMSEEEFRLTLAKEQIVKVSP